MLLLLSQQRTTELTESRGLVTNPSGSALERRARQFGKTTRIPHGALAEFGTPLQATVDVTALVAFRVSGN